MGRLLPTDPDRAAVHSLLGDVMIVRAMYSCVMAMMLCVACSAAEVERLSDVQDRFISVEQGWGELGINTAVHAAGVATQPLQIGDKKYASGLGHHANGAVEIAATDGEFEHFDSDVGVQPLPPIGQGSVVFQVYVDDKLQFDSGVMRGGEAAKTVSLDVKAHKSCGWWRPMRAMASLATARTGRMPASRLRRVQSVSRRRNSKSAISRNW